MASLLLFGCHSTKENTSNSIWDKTVPTGDASALTTTAKSSAFSEVEKQKWPHTDLLTDSVPGISLQKAYEFLKGKEVQPITVGVIDSGIDIDHEDLKDLLWTNPVDNSVNNTDDDKNKYTDDVHGWNFLGGKEGEAAYERNELTREYAKYSKRFKGVNEASVEDVDKAAYAKYLKLKAEYEVGVNQYKPLYDSYTASVKAAKAADLEVKSALKKDNYTLEEVKALPETKNTKMIIQVLSQGLTVEDAIAQYDGPLKILSTIIEQKFNPEFNGRQTSDNPEDISDVVYGNNYVKGSLTEESHGTHVAGIILGNRHNQKGIQGVTDKAKLITVRAIPNGDEHDKDVALAIHYMVDNGAKVINMSFGKGTSPNPEWVYNAMKYAASKDVLLVKAAGNEGNNIDEIMMFPNDAMDNVNEFTNNVITVGANTRFFNEKLVGDFSNYGKISVDIFAPGDGIYSTIPNSEYDYKNGTSMASPQVAGVAALVRAYYPQLSAAQVKQIIMNSVTKVDMDVFVPKTAGKKKKNFSEFSKSGRILNAYNAVKMADDMVSE
ncbi:S8 family serine peptidase [Tamlana agarivorans]|uniref:S8 family serine peptidase n=1 Tax=Pseudotamlana agarivorans TaxID=481183 RepID=A0ACC5U9V2_9FLAO|nr:S8 family serine peptidase [Tamlana agarivorans]MBU2951096.1 S8 family serine peptidase [Tamlana agarivorans]